MLNNKDLKSYFYDFKSKHYNDALSTFFISEWPGQASVVSGLHVVDFHANEDVQMLLASN